MLFIPARGDGQPRRQLWRDAAAVKNREKLCCVSSVSLLKQYSNYAEKEKEKKTNKLISTRQRPSNVPCRKKSTD